jgi:hypothetical protein
MHKIFPHDVRRCRLALAVVSNLVAFTGPTACRKAEGHAPTSTEAPPVGVVASATLVKVVLLQDASGSVTLTRTPHLVPGDVERLVARLSSLAEADVGFGLISGTSDVPLLRLRISASPAERSTGAAEAPNPFDHLYASGEREHVRFLDKLRRWTEDRDADLAPFQASVAELVARPAHGCTDLEGALARADAMLDEPEARYAATQEHLYAVLVTDGIRTAGQPVKALRANAVLLVVNGNGEVGALAPLHPLVFESPARAIAYILDRERGRDAGR